MKYKLHKHCKEPLLPTGSEEREVLGVGSIHVASCQYMHLWHNGCIDMNIVG